MIRVSSQGDFKKTLDFLNRSLKGDHFSELDRYGRMGVEALAKSTPIDTGLTSRSWNYRIVKAKNAITIEWYNSNMAGDTPVAILIQYGHATGTGGYVVGRDFINPPMRPLFDQIAEEIWKKVKT